MAETPRLRLRLYEERDCEDMTHYLSDDDVNLPMITPPSPFLLKHAYEFLAKMQKAYEAGKPEFFVMADKESDRLLGGIGVHAEHTLSKRPEAGEIGYWLGKPHWGQGLMQEAMPVVMACAFTQLGFKLLVATTNTDNDLSRRLLHHCGFSFLGIKTPLQKASRGTDQVTHWELTPEQFKQRYPDR